MAYHTIIESARGTQPMTKALREDLRTDGRKLREDLTKEEKERLEKYGVIEFESAGAIRKR